MTDQIDRRILDFIGEHHVLTVACASQTGELWCANAFYVFDEKEEGFEKLQGYQDYSIQLGDVSFTIDWAAPTALPLFRPMSATR